MTLIIHKIDQEYLVVLKPCKDIETSKVSYRPEAQLVEINTIP